MPIPSALAMILTWFSADHSRRLLARFKLALLALLAVSCVAITFSPWKTGYADDPTRDMNGDIALFRAIVDRVHAGEGYYDAFGADLRARNYPAASVFNWRMPLPLWLIGRLPEIVLAKVLLSLIGLTVLVWGFDWNARETSLTASFVSSLALTGAVMPAVLGDLMVMPELWSGLLIALSLCCYGRNQRTAAVAAGVAALFFRELAAPYVLLMMAFAVRERQWKELARWSLGIAVFAVHYGLHVSQVVAHQLPTDRTHPESWIQFLGLPFVISTAQMNCYLLLLPQWVTALFVVLALAGIAAWKTPAHARLGSTIWGFCAAFCVVGQPFNQYWGSMYAPLLALAAGRSAQCVAELWQRAELPSWGGGILRSQPALDIRHSR